MLKLVDIIRTLSELGSATPAFVALFNQVKATFTPQEQEVLQHAYDEAKAKSDAAHEGLQNDLKAAAKK